MSRFGHRQLPNFLGLLIWMFMMIVFSPFVQENPVIVKLIDYMVYGVFLFSVYAITETRRELFIGMSLVAVTIIIKVLSESTISDVLDILSTIINLGFFIFFIVVMGQLIARAKKVNLNLIYAALCLYLLIGIMWGIGYSLVEYLMPNSFAWNHALYSGNVQEASPATYPQSFIYFSFVTQTTLGYGDLIPISAPARSLTIVESVIGQFYIAVVLARLLGMEFRDSKK